MWPFHSGYFDKSEKRDNGFTAFLDTARPVAAGVSVTKENAVNLPAVYKCVTLNAETVSSLPVNVYSKRGKNRVPRSDPAWLRDPNDFQTLREFLAVTQVSLDLAGNAYWLKTSAGNKLVGLDVLAPDAVEPRVEDGLLLYYVTLKDGRRPFAATEIVHLRGLTMPGQLVGLSPIECAKQTIGIGFASESYGAQFFGTGATLSGIISSPTTMTQEQAERLREAFTKKHGGVNKSHALGVLSGGATWTPLSVKPEEAQFLETRKYTNIEVAEMFGFPTNFFSTDGAKGYVTALHATMRLWNITGLNSRIVRIEDALTSLLPRGVYVKMNRNALVLQMDPAERTSFYQAAQLGQWMSIEEIRALEDMNPEPDGTVLHSVQWQENQPDNDPDDEPAPSGLFDGGAE